MWISHKTQHHAVPWPLLKYPCVPRHCLPQRGPGGRQKGWRGHLDRGKHGNQETRLGNWVLIEGQERKTQKPAAREWDRKLLSDSDICMLAAAFDVTTAFAFVSLTSCQFDSDVAISAHALPQGHTSHKRRTAAALLCGLKLWPANT